MSGASTRRRVEEVLGETIAKRMSGILTLSMDKVRRLFCLENGRLVHAASNIIEEQFEEFLVRERHIAAADRAHARVHAATTGDNPLDWLVEQELLSRVTLETLVRDYTAQLMGTAIAHPAVRIDFQEGRANLSGKTVTDLPLGIALLNYLRANPADAAEVRVRIGAPRMRPKRIESSASMIDELEVAHPGVRSIWRLAEGGLTLPELCREAPCGEELALRMVYALLLIGAVDPGVEDTFATPRTTQHAAVTRNELLARLDKAIDVNHYEILELMPNATDDQIRDSYYLLARRYHPDRFRSGDLVELMPRIEEFFAKVTEAYNTLNHPDRRAPYDEELTLAETRGESQEPQHDAAYLARQNFIRARALIKRNQYQQAVTFLENAIELQANVPEFHIEFGRVLTRNPRRRDEAEEHLRRGIELDPTVIDGHAALADLLVKRDQHEQAVRVLNEGMNWHPEHPELVRRLTELGQTKTKGRGLFGR